MRKLRKRKKYKNRTKGRNKKLTFKQERFVFEYIKDYDGGRAAIEAGYSKKGAHVRASELLNLRKIKDAIEAKQKAIAEKCEITREKVLQDLEETRLRALENKSYGAAARCSELHGKHLAMFTDKQMMDIKPEMTFEEVQELENSILEKLKRLAGESPEIIDITPEPCTEHKMIPLKKQKRKLKQPRKRNERKKGRAIIPEIQEPEIEPEN